MSDVIPPTADELAELGIEIPREGKVILDIFTEWCGPCKALGPILEKLAEDGEFALVRQDLDQMEALSEKFHVTAIPTLIFFKDGERIGDVKCGDDEKEIPLNAVLSDVLGQFKWTLKQDGTPVESLDSFILTLQKTLVNNGVRVGGMSEEDLRTILDQM